MCVTNPIH